MSVGGEGLCVAPGAGTSEPRELVQCRILTVAAVVQGDTRAHTHTRKRVREEQVHCRSSVDCPVTISGLSLRSALCEMLPLGAVGKGTWDFLQRFFSVATLLANFSCILALWFPPGRASPQG